ncbi:peptidase S1, partial [Burkholderia cenocepacia]|nr:peptidase S1 [Burkholderia cenocepacia]
LAADRDLPVHDRRAFRRVGDRVVRPGAVHVGVDVRLVAIGGKTIKYTATTGHLTTIDPITSAPNAKMFYVAYTQDNPDPSKPRPVT